ncbi:3-dehydroquinate synthase family protein [Actinospongicola halichondriae]|uniref:3-dehydroquinate synthase family protein n=1 Tax=Actinospongicola halichondriae TaxID=3236844 RepID=UPI003D50194A
MIRVEVPVPGRTYDAVVGRDILDEVAALVPSGAKRAAVVTQRGIGVNVDPGVDHRVFTIADGEGAKSLSTIEMLCRNWAGWGLTRSDVVIAIGGGVVTDVAGFAAATYHRGVGVIHVPTTLLGMIDAAIGGKTGVNLPEGKNLVGAFWQPQGVLCDLATLDTLPPRERRSGMGELAKYRFLPGGDDLETLEFDEQVARCIEIKAEVVASDEREGGRRAILNYGHTLAHAIETAGTYDLRHGEAVAVGLHYAAHLAARLGRIDDERVREHREVLGHYDLPIHLPEGLGDDELLSLMGRDKKAVDGLTFALDGPDGVEVVNDVDVDVARAALADVR